MATQKKRIGACVLMTVCGLILLAGCADVRVALGPRVTQADLQKIKKVAVLFGAGAASAGSGAHLGGDPAAMLGMLAMRMPGMGSIETFNDHLVLELLGLGWDVVERKQLDKVTSEQALSLSGLTEADKNVALGKILAVDAIITGNVDIRQEYDTGWLFGIGAGMKEVVKTATLRMLDVEKGNTLVAISATYSRGEEQQNVARDLADALKKKIGK
jgi:curli biogenesis system outer membrane secretion channel CsgG